LRLRVFFLLQTLSQIKPIFPHEAEEFAAAGIGLLQNPGRPGARIDDAIDKLVREKMVSS
jgi:hypothetical protein